MPSVTTAQTQPWLERAIRLERVSFRYPGSQVDAVADVSGEIPANAITLITGPSGSGKSTLADILMGLMPPTSGRVLIDDTPLTDANRRLWRQRAAYLPQDAPLHAGTTRDNLLWARPDADDETLDRALASARAVAFVDALPQGIDTLLGDRGMRLSGGQRQRIALARTLLRRPELLILDEATAGLDSATAADIEATLKQLTEQLTVVLLGHQHDDTVASKVIRLPGPASSSVGSN